MQAALFEIHEKVKYGDMDFARFSGFRCGAPLHVDALSILNLPGISLYCLDEERRQAVFVETPPEIDLTRQAFYYQAQYRCARRVLCVPYETLNELATETGEPFRKLVLIFSVERCGSTLLSRALNCLDTVLCALHRSPARSL
jgi:hypothetical protein